VILPLFSDKFSVPANVLVIGTMNTADRSIALLDIALRRRFGFVELMPDSSTLAGAIAGEAIPLGQWLDALNTRIREHIGKDARNLQIGHAYLMDENGKPVTE
jgi:5-methylcytosine-specific restriction enzyme B